MFPQAAYEFVSISDICLHFFFFSEYKKISFSFLFLSHFVCFILIFEISDILKCLCEGINSPWRAVLFCSISASFLWVDSSVECFDLDFSAYSHICFVERKTLPIICTEVTWRVL